MIEKYEGFTMTCDLCGHELELLDDCTAIFDTEGEATTNARECGWKEIEPGKWACEDCLEELNPDDYESI